MQIGLVWLLVVFRAKAHKALFCDEGDWETIRVRTDLSHHHVYSQVELLPVYQKRVFKVLLGDVTLCKCIWRNLFKVLNQKYAATFCASMRFDYESFLFMRSHIPFTSLSFLLQFEGHRDEIEIMFKMPRHPFENSGELGFVCSDTCSRQTIEDSCCTHYPLIV